MAEYQVGDLVTITSERPPGVLGIRCGGPTGIVREVYDSSPAITSVVYIVEANFSQAVQQLGFFGYQLEPAIPVTDDQLADHAAKLTAMMRDLEST